MRDDFGKKAHERISMIDRRVAKHLLSMSEVSHRLAFLRVLYGARSAGDEYRRICAIHPELCAPAVGEGEDFISRQSYAFMHRQRYAYVASGASPSVWVEVVGGPCDGKLVIVQWDEGLFIMDGHRYVVEPRSLDEPAPRYAFYAGPDCMNTEV